MAEKMTPREQLIAAGVSPWDIDSHESDLYVKATGASKAWLDTYEWKANVTMFTDLVTCEPWYDIPFGYMAEFMDGWDRWACERERRANRPGEEACREA